MPNLSNTVTFLFAGDGSLASEGLSVFLQTKSNFLMISECSDGATAIAEIEAHSPEIAVIDAHLLDMNASQIVDAVRIKNRETKIIILGISADRQIADQLLASGADAYVVRNGPSRHLNDAIRYVRDGGKYLAPELTQDLPVTAKGLVDDHGESVSSLRKAVEAQAITVERLEQAMDRAKHAIELLQQTVEQLSGVSVESSPSPQPPDQMGMGRNRVLPGLRSGMGAVAAALMMGIMGFLLADVLRPGPESAIAEFSSAGAEDALKAASTVSLHLANWETNMVEKATGLLKKQQYAAAEKLCRDLLKQDPANTAASRVLASALFHQNRVEESADVVRSMAVPAAHLRKVEPQVTFDN
jgi:DNA-binding response OmpR family regulator